MDHYNFFIWYYIIICEYAIWYINDDNYPLPKETMEILENKVTKILQEHHIIDESDSVEVTNFGVNYFDDEVLDVKIEFWLSLDDHRHTVTFLISKKQKKLDFCFIAGYSLLMHGFYIEKYKYNYEQIALDLLKEAKNSTNDNLKEVVNVILEHSKQRKYKCIG